MANRYRVQIAFQAGDVILKRGRIISGETAEGFKNYKSLVETGYITAVEEKEITPEVIEIKPKTKKGKDPK
jgi:hypothetical protein